MAKSSATRNTNPNKWIALLEDQLARYVGTQFCIATGSGTAALVAALQSLKLPRNSEVVISPILCPTVLLAIIFSGLKPIFCDVNLSDYQMNPKSISDIISDKTEVIIAAHLFGQTYNVEAIKKIAKKHSLVIIEDAAQSFGGEYKGKKHGSFGDLSITSFGHGKIIDSGNKVMTGGGGAVFTDDAEMYKNVKLVIEKWGEYGAKLVETIYIRVYGFMFKGINEVYETSNRYINFYKIIPHIGRYFEKTFVYRMPKGIPQKILMQLCSIDDDIKMRTRNAYIYKNLLASNNIIHPKYANESSVYFRYSCLLKPNCRPRFIHEVRKRGIKIGTLYSPPLYLIYGRTMKWPNCEFVSSRIFNLMVDSTLGEEKIEWISNNINKIADECYEREKES